MIMSACPLVVFPKVRKLLLVFGLKVEHHYLSRTPYFLPMPTRILTQKKAELSISIYLGATALFILIAARIVKHSTGSIKPPKQQILKINGLIGHLPLMQTPETWRFILMESCGVKAITKPYRFPKQPKSN